MHIYQLTNANGNPWANQFCLSFDEPRVEILQSYQSMVVMIDFDEHHVTLGEDWDYSKTTMRAVKKFLEENIGGTWAKADISRAIKDEYITLYCRNGKTEGWSFANGCDSFFKDFIKTRR